MKNSYAVLWPETWFSIVAQERSGWRSNWRGNCLRSGQFQEQANDKGRLSKQRSSDAYSDGSAAKIKPSKKLE